MMYELLLRFLPRQIAHLAMIIWYTLLLLLIFLAWDLPQAEFRYGFL